jgi:hypothetical protein
MTMGRSGSVSWPDPSLPPPSYHEAADCGPRAVEVCKILCEAVARDDAADQTRLPQRPRTGDQYLRLRGHRRWRG